MVEIEVADTGAGIAPEHLASLFSEFMTTKSGGMGLGLPISRTIVEAHGGKIWAENRAEGGAVVPLHPAARAAAQARSRRFNGARESLSRAQRRTRRRDMAQEQAILAGGCFWCTEAVFKDLIGVSAVESGYIGGHVDNPTYRQVCGGDTGHAEAIRVTFDPDLISYDDMLDIHFATHDPTQLNRQGNDVGTQYRSAIFPASPAQEEAARRGIERAAASWPDPIVTTIEPLGPWWPAEDYHQDYWEGEGQRNPYCLAVIPPKLQKLRKSFAARLKSEAPAG